MIDDEELSEAYNLGYSCAKDMAMEEITRLRAENEKLREALNPFAAYVEQPARIYENELGVRMALIDQDLLMRLCQAAAAAIRETGNGRD